MKYMLLILMALWLFLLYWVFLRVSTRRKAAILRQLERLDSVQTSVMVDPELKIPFKDRVLAPLLEKLGTKLGRFAPKQAIERDLGQMVNAGLSLDSSTWMGIRISFFLVMVFIGIFFSISSSNLLLDAMLISGFLIVGIIGPTFYLRAKIQQRQAVIEKSLPDVLDLLLVSVEAGLGFDAALSKVVEKTDGAVSDEFYRTMQEIKMGKSRADAMRDMAVRINLDDLTSFIGSVIQADKLGVSIANVLRVQSKDMKTKRKQRAEQKAQKAPIKITLVTLLFIFPSIFIIVIGPMVIKYMNS